MSDPLLTLVERMALDAVAARRLPSLEQWSMRASLVPALDRCPECGGQPLHALGSQQVRCSCGWSGVAVRRLP